jgi:hypothetical protein
MFNIFFSLNFVLLLFDPTPRRRANRKMRGREKKDAG